MINVLVYTGIVAYSCVFWWWVVRIVLDMIG